MSRDIDRVIDYINSRDYLSETLRRVLVNRIEPEPTKEELAKANSQLYRSRNNTPEVLGWALADRFEKKGRLILGDIRMNADKTFDIWDGTWSRIRIVEESDG